MLLGGDSSEDAARFEELLNPRSNSDPSALYSTFRDRARPTRLLSGGVVVARHEDVVSVLRHPGFGKPPLPRQPFRSVRAMSRMFLVLDPPDHTRLRKVVSPFFTPPVIAERRAAMESLAAELLARQPAVVDLVRDIAYPLPMAIISQLLVVPESDQRRLSAWTRVLAETLDVPMPVRAANAFAILRAVITRRTRPLVALRAVNGIVRYAKNRVATADGEIVAALRDALASGEITDDEAVATWVLLLLAGHETTANLTANCVHALATHPSELAKLRENPALIRSAVEETLRYDSPVPLAVRVATEAAEINGTPIEPGTWVYALVGAANRDPRIFDEPDRFSVTRTSVSHLGLGHGLHFCLGAFLARLEVEVVLAAILRRAPQLRLAGPAKRRRTFAVRGFDSLPLELGSGA